EMVARRRAIDGDLLQGEHRDGGRRALRRQRRRIEGVAAEAGWRSGVTDEHGHWRRGVDLPEVPARRRDEVLQAAGGARARAVDPIDAVCGRRTARAAY